MLICLPDNYFKFSMATPLIQQTMQVTSEITLSFWDWPGVLAICAVLVFLGRLIDWLLRQHHKEAILDWLSEQESKLKYTPIREWQAQIAKWVVSFWKILVRLPDIAKHLRSFVFVLLLLVVLVVLVRSIADDWCLKGFLLPSFFFMLMVLPAAMLGKVLTFPGQEVDLIRTELLNGSVYSSLSILIRPLRWFYRNVFCTSLVSTIFTTIAIMLGLGIARGDTESYWYMARGSGIYPRYPLGLTALNFPFDFLTIIISIKLLRWMVTKGRQIELIAFIDILISATLTITLHTVLKIIEAGNMAFLATHLINSWNWFVNLVTFRASPMNPDWPLTPVLLTTFIPVTTYMAVFIFLGFILKPFTRITGYLCGLLGEKEKTPFFELAFVFSLFTTAAKAFSEWPYFKQAISRLF